MALTFTPQVKFGVECPEFDLPLTTGEQVQAQEFKQSGRPFLIVFICNHCPYVKAIEARLIALGSLLNQVGIKMLAINSNDSTRYPDDSFEKMQDKTYPFGYAFDESQEVARRFGAVCTPDFFLYDRQGLLSYRGRLDDNWKDATLVTSYELLQAIWQLDQGQPLNFEQIPSMGCSIKWKSN